MPCGCKKNSAPGCQNCEQGFLSVNDWVDCQYWSNREELPLLTAGSYAKYTSGAVRTKRTAKCEQYEPKQTH